MSDADDAPKDLPLALTDQEVDLLARGILEWGGPAHCTEEFAVAMGFACIADLLCQRDRIHGALLSGRGLSSLDWARLLLMVEIVFVSDSVGSGVDWSTTTGYSDEDTIRLLRSIQRKLVRVVAPLIGTMLGTK